MKGPLDPILSGEATVEIPIWPPLFLESACWFEFDRYFFLDIVFDEEYL